MNDRFHGGTKKNFVDFSVNLNPVIKPVLVEKLVCKHANAAIHYPEQRGESLIKEITQKYKLLKDNIFLGNGSIEIFYMIPRFLDIKRIYTLEPTFCEYRYVSNINKIEHKSILQEGTFFWDLEKVRRMLNKGDAVFICNPNNPTGSLFRKEEILKLLDSKAYIIVDEAFMDFALKDESLLREASEIDNLIVIKSLTKIYSIAGLRVGFCVASKEVIKKMKALAPLWNINGIAIEVAKEMINNDALIEQTKHFISKEREFITKKLSSIGNIEIFNSNANFFLARSSKTESLISFLAKNNIVVRNHKGFFGLDKNFFRFAIKTRKENKILIDLIKFFFKRGYR